MKHFGWSTFVVGLMFFSVIAIAFAINEEEWNGDTGSSFWEFSGGVLIDGVELPSDLGDDVGTSTVSTTGTGAVTILNRTRSGLSLTFPGGTDISVTREHDTESPTNLWWEGILTAPQPGENPIYDGENIYFDKDGLHPNSRVHVVSTFTMGLPNEEYNFSNTATFNFTGIDEASGKKIWYALKETEAPEDEADVEWEIFEDNFCVVQNGVCEVELDELNAVTFVREIFSQCPRTSGSDTKIENGLTSGEPWCDVSCDRGYEVDYAEMKCVPVEGFISEELPVEPEIEEPMLLEEVEEEVFVRPGWFRYTGTNEQSKKKSVTGLVGEDRIRVQRNNAAVRKTVGDGNTEEMEEVVDDNKDNFMNYLWRVREFFGEHPNVVTVSEEVETGEMVEGEMGESEVHASAPILPRTGPGIFVGLAAVGLGLMVIGGRRRH